MQAVVPANVEGESPIRSSLEAVVREFFRDYGLEVAPESSVSLAPESAPTSEITSVVGFKSEQLRGGLALVAPLSLVVATLPVVPSPTRLESQLLDWSGEMTNQLLGRLKNKLAALSIDFDIGSPASFRAFKVRFGPANDCTKFCALSVAAIGALVCVDYEDSGLAIASMASRSLGEGEVVLF